MATKPLFLVGYMGCGKSTMGRKLARRLGRTFVDTDALVEESEGASVVDIFQYEGEERFRMVERRVLEYVIAQADDLTDACAGRYCNSTTADISQLTGDTPVHTCGMVVSTGGGLPTWQDNMARMNEVGVTVYLRRTPHQIAARLTPYGRQKRPRLRGLNDEELLTFMIGNMAEREPFYVQAQLTIDCAGMSDAEVVERILEEVKPR